MKISAIEISDYYQFKNLTIDLTYPQGHAKAGQPLDKVCIIGQNGTGKTSILRLIHDCCLMNNMQGNNEGASLQSKKSNGEVLIKVGNVCYPKQRNWISNEENKPKNFIKKLIYMPTNAYNTISPKLPNQKKEEQLKPSNYFPLTQEKIQQLSTYLYDWYEKYSNALVTFSLSIFNNLKKDKTANVADDLQVWIEKNPNPLDKIALFIDELLKSAQVKLKTEVVQNSKMVEIELVLLKNDEVVPFSQLSSGTKNIFLTAYALFMNIENETIVLIDEPENSLYPDLQRAIISSYTSLRPEAETQFFFATHSPVIASCFEPWEIVDLELDDNNQVFRHLYYEGKNHVDNYTIYPQYLRWDAIMNKVFDIKDTEGGERRDAELQKLVETKNKLDYWKSEGKTAKTDEKMRQELEVYKKMLAKLY